VREFTSGCWGLYLLRYAQEAARRVDNRRMAYGQQVGALRRWRWNEESVDFSVYWAERQKSLTRRRNRS
jgi:hypothetical protein